MADVVDDQKGVDWLETAFPGAREIYDSAVGDFATPGDKLRHVINQLTSIERSPETGKLRETYQSQKPTLPYKSRENDFVELGVPGSTQKIRVSRNELSPDQWESYKTLAENHSEGSSVVETSGPGESIETVRPRAEAVAPKGGEPLRETANRGGGGGPWQTARRMMGALVTNASPVVDQKNEGWWESVKRQGREDEAAHAGDKSVIEPGPAFAPAIDDKTLRAAEEVFQRAGIPPAGAGRDGYTLEDIEYLSRSGGREFAPESRMSGEQKETLINRVAPGMSMKTPEALKAERGVPVSPDQVVTSPHPDAPPGVGGVNLLGSIPGGSVGPSAMDGAEQGLRNAMDLGAKAIRGQADLEGQRLDATAKLQQRSIDAATDAQQRIQHTQELRQAAVEDARRAYEKTLARVNDPAQTVDPGRFWNSRTTGQKILAGISVILGGLGQGTFAALGIKSENGALKILQDAIKEDVEAQHVNIANKRGALKDALGGQQDLHSMLRQDGMDQIEALRGEEAAKIDIVQRQIEQLAAQMGTPEAKAKAESTIAALEVDKAKLFSQIAQHRDSFALEKAKLATSKFGIMARLAAKGGPGAKTIASAQTEKIGELDAAIKLATGYMEQFAKASNVPGARFVPGSFANEYAANRPLIKQQIGKPMEGGVLRKEDEEKYDKIIPQAGDFVTGAKRWAKILESLKVKRQKVLEDFARSGYNTSGYAGTGDAEPGSDNATDLGFEE